MSSNSDSKQENPTATRPSRLQIRLPSKSNQDASPATNANAKSDAKSDTKSDADADADANVSNTSENDNNNQQKNQSKPWPKYPPKPLLPIQTANQTFSRTDQIHVHHQNTSLHFIYNHINNKWSYMGETTIYLSHQLIQDDSHDNTNINTNDNVHAQSTSSLNKGNTHMREIAFHTRGGSKLQITKATVTLPLPSCQTPSSTSSLKDNAILTPMRAEVLHHDPLSKILTKPAASFTPKEFYPPPPGSNEAKKSRRYEADSQSNRGGQGMMDAMRCASIASYFGEGRARFPCPSVRVAGQEELRRLWRKDLDSLSEDEERGALEGDIRGMDYERGGKRRVDRLDLIADLVVKEQFVDKNVAGASSKQRSDVKESTSHNHDDASNTSTTPDSHEPASDSGPGPAQGLKLVIQFQMQNLESIAHLGGIHFHAPEVIKNDTQSHLGRGTHPRTNATTPHVYTTCGITGDHQGTRSWVPTIDSASSKHRATHEVTVRVTADSREGLWAAGCGEHFGVSKTVLHSVPRGVVNGPNSSSLIAEKQSDPEEKELVRVLGKASVDYITKTFKNSLLEKEGEKPAPAGRDGEKRVHVIPLENDITPSDHRFSMHTQLATSTWTTSMWSPCPARSLGFAIGPFDVIYDPEYYGKDTNDDEDEEEQEGDDNEEEEKEEDYPTVRETADKYGEGIRQLYFALKDERPHIHANARIVGMEGVRGIQRSPSTAIDTEVKKQMILSITGSTAGVPNRALSLMRDILSLPSYRTMSYTQIWIPDAVDGGVSCGTLHACPEISCNPFLGGAILDTKLLHPVGYRLPFYAGGRVLQFAQARCAVRGWITSALPLGGTDDVGHSYLHTLIEKFIMSLYERAHGAYGEGGSKHGFYFSKRFAISSGLNSKNMEFLPVTNVEDEDLAFAPAMGAVGSLPVDERGTQQLWRNANNGTESHTVTLDEFSVNQLLSKDVLEGIERLEKSLPSMGWLGSLLSATFLTSNSTSSSRVGCGAVELQHPIGGAVYRDLKCRSLAKTMEGRAGISNFVRVVRAAFCAAILGDKGASQVDLPQKKTKKNRDGQEMKRRESESSDKPKPIFIMCVNELLKKGGLAHGSFIRSLRLLSGSIREPYLRGDLVDVTRKSRGLIPAQPEGFPNSFVRGSCGLYLRVGVHVEAVSLGDGQVKNTNLQAHILAEPVIPEGGIAFGGPMTLRIIERGGQCREFVRVVESDGSRSDWGPITLYGDPVTTVKKQLSASGTIEATHGSKKASGKGEKREEDENAYQVKESLLGTSSMFNHPGINDNLLHRGGYQALELVRLNNRTSLLWVRVDPHGIFDGRIALFQQDACLGEQLFHDGDASSQVEALRSLAERPLRVQGCVKVKSLYGVPVEELPVHLLADCLRGSVALHADLPHNPCIRLQAAFAIAQWQNNKAPTTQNAVGWIGLHLLVQYFNERFYKNGNIVSAKFSRLCLRANSGAEANNSNANNQTSTDSGEYEYLDMFTSEQARLNAIENAKSAEREEDEEYRVRSAVVTAIACVRAKDGTTPRLVLEVLQKILETGNETGPISTGSLEEECLMRSKRHKSNAGDHQHDYHELLGQEEQWFEDIDSIPYISSSLVGDALLSLCYINARPEVIEDPTTGKQVQSRANHPCLSFIRLCKKWLEWDLYKENISLEAQMKHMSPTGRSSVIAPCAITALYSLALLRQITTDSSVDDIKAGAEGSQKRKRAEVMNLIESATDSNFYAEIFDSKPLRCDATRAAAAQAVLSLCCASDRNDTSEAVGLLTGLEFVLKRMLEPSTSPGLRQTLASLMGDACTGKICSSQRVAAMTKSNSIIDSGNLMYNGPLGAHYGSENGSSIHTFVTESTMPAANAVNNGARRGLRLLRQAGKPGQNIAVSEITLVRIATFATDMWRTVNGELGGIESNSGVCEGVTPITSAVDGICSHDGILRCSLLSLWQWLWPKACIARLRVQSWKEHESTVRYKALGADKVMKIEESEKEAALAEDKSCNNLRDITTNETDRQRWRGEMAKVRREEVAAAKDTSVNSQGVNYPLHPIAKNDSWKNGGWVACAHDQRRSMGTDGGSTKSVTKLRLTVKGSD